MEIAIWGVFSFLLGLLLIFLFVVAVVVVVRQEALRQGRDQQAGVRNDQKPHRLTVYCEFLMTRTLIVAFGVSLMLALPLAYGSLIGRGAVQAGVDMTRAERIDLENCAACHGEKGDGKGTRTNRLKTKPRDFTKT
ncbi:MAG TPA: hypothetical protein VNL14_23375 [Candidatus Acidoferrales bacterium]|nr:hypothetical protein [Candidatus Acidoferrales bacterium]